MKYIEMIVVVIFWLGLHIIGITTTSAYVLVKLELPRQQVH